MSDRSEYRRRTLNMGTYYSAHKDNSAAAGCIAAAIAIELAAPGTFFDEQCEDFKARTGYDALVKEKK